MPRASFPLNDVIHPIDTTSSGHGGPGWRPVEASTAVQSTAGRSPRLTGLLLAGLLLVGCATSAPPDLVRATAPPAAAVDPAKPCSQERSIDVPGPRAAPAGVRATFDRLTNKITLSAGEAVTLPALSQAVNDPGALDEIAPGEWLLGADLDVLAGAGLEISAPEVRWLKLRSDSDRFASLRALGGRLDITGTCVTSWNTRESRADTEYDTGRSFLLARDGAQMVIDRGELRYLGFGAVESYGLSWRTVGTGGSITNSVISHLYFGLYTYQVDGLLVADNEVHDNVLYGIDPHTGSKNLRIERNRVHDNGKHGIILAEDCTDSIIRDNVVYRNSHHGIVLYQRSDRNLIENNDSFGNAAHGININESSGNTVRANRVYDNAESGIDVGQTARDNLLDRNDVRSNSGDGVRLVTESAQTTISGNIIGGNQRYGVYIDTDGAFELRGNTIFGSGTGVLLKGVRDASEGDNEMYDNGVDIRRG